MNPIVFAMRHPVSTMMLVVAFVSGGVFSLYKMRVDIAALSPLPRFTRVLIP